MKKRKFKTLNFDKIKIASLSNIINIVGGSGDCGDPGGSDTKNKSGDVKKCPQGSPPNSGSPVTCDGCVPPDMTDGDNCA